jgi:hypothetical protein
MKGIVFTEFLEMVESQYGLVMADKIVNENELDSGGAYTSVGTYNHTEMVQLVTNLSKETELSVGQLLEIYGRHFFSMATKNYKQFFNTITSSLSFYRELKIIFMLRYLSCTLMPNFLDSKYHSLQKTS